MNILLLRGLGREKRHWGTIPHELEELGIHSYLIDLPGMGSKNEILSANSIDGIIKHLREEWIRISDSNNETFLLGHSLGGMISLRWVELYPNDFKGAILVNTSAHNAALPWQRLTIFGMKKMIQILKSKDLKSRESRTIEMISNKEIRNYILKEWIRLAEEYPCSNINLVQQLTAALMFSAPKSIEIPCLFLASKLDKMVSYKNSVNLAKKYSSSLLLHDSAGHDLAMDDPSWFCKSIKNWMESQ